MVKCPVCESELKAVRSWNPEIFGTGEDNPIDTLVCRNDECKGWFCNCCDKYHPFGTACSVAIIKTGRSEDDGYSWGDNRGRELYRSLHQGVIE